LGEDFGLEPRGQIWRLLLAKRGTVQRLARWVVCKLRPQSLKLGFNGELVCAPGIAQSSPFPTGEEAHLRDFNLQISDFSIY
jgi:hypothetical protein